MLGVPITLNYRNGDSRLSLEEVQDPVIRLVQFLVDLSSFDLSITFLTADVVGV